jgi:hypothetical protein
MTALPFVDALALISDAGKRAEAVPLFILLYKSVC